MTINVKSNNTPNTSLTPPIDKKRDLPTHTWMKNMAQAAGYPANGTYQSIFNSGPVQFCGNNGLLFGSNHLIFGTKIPNPGSNIATGGSPCLLLGGYWPNGAISSLAAIIQDVAVAGNNGISLIISSGSTGSPDLPSDNGGSLRIVAGSTGNGAAGQMYIQGAPALSGQGGSIFISGGDTTTGAPGDVFISGCLAGPTGSNVHIAMTEINGVAGTFDIRCNSNILYQYTSTGAFFCGSSGAGSANQPLVSNGTGNTMFFQNGFTGNIPVGAANIVVSAGIILGYH